MIINRNILHIIGDKMAFDRWKNGIKKINEEYSLLFVPSDTGELLSRYLPFGWHDPCCGLHDNVPLWAPYNHYNGLRNIGFTRRMRIIPCECGSGLGRLEVYDWHQDIIHPHYRKN